MPATATKPKTKNVSINKKGLGASPIGASKTVKALMYRMDVTSPKVVTMTALKTFTLKAKTMNTCNRTVMADAPTVVLAGTTLHFVASDDLPGWYYVGRVDHASASCTCSAHQNRLPCKHKPLIMAAHQARQARQNRQIAAEIVEAFAAIEENAPVTEECEDLMDDDSKLEKWASEELTAMPTTCPPVAPQAPDFANMTNDEIRAYWKEVAKQERVEKIARGKARWANFDRLASRAS